MDPKLKGKTYIENELESQRHDLWEDDFDMIQFEKDFNRFKKIAFGIFIIFILTLIAWYLGLIEHKNNFKNNM